MLAGPDRRSSPTPDPGDVLPPRRGAARRPTIWPPPRRRRGNCSPRNPGDVARPARAVARPAGTGDTKAAERTLRDIVTRDPQDANALNSLGYMLAERGDRLDEAVELLQRALKIDPANPSFLDSLGWAYFQQGHLDLGRPAADAGGRQAAEQLGRPGASRRPPLQAAAIRRRRVRVGARALRGRPVDRPGEDREEDPRRPRSHGPAVIRPHPAGAARRIVRARCSSPPAGGSACGAKAPSLPTAGGTPFPEAGSRVCRGHDRMPRRPDPERRARAVGQGRRQKLRGRILGGFAEPGKVRLEAPAPFGRSVFTLVVHAALPRWSSTASAACSRMRAPAELVEALTGVALGPDELRAVLAGCGFGRRRHLGGPGVSGRLGDGGRSGRPRRGCGGWPAPGGCRGRARRSRDPLRRLRVRRPSTVRLQTTSQRAAPT